MISGWEALKHLQDGNLQYATALRDSHVQGSARARRDQMVRRQEPFAVILGCSDSRVPVEIIFRQGPGGVFVIRIAGNISAPSVIGSVEFAVEQLGTRLVVVLGHSGCGAVSATLQALQQPAGNLSPHLRSIVDRIKPSVEGLLALHPASDQEQLLRLAIRANIRASVRQLCTDSQVISQLISADGLLVLGAEYSLETGVVDFLDGFPTTS